MPSWCKSWKPQRDRAVHDQYGVDAVPLLVIADRTGAVRAHFFGPVDRGGHVVDVGRPAGHLGKRRGQFSSVNRYAPGTAPADDGVPVEPGAGPLRASSMRRRDLGAVDRLVLEQRPGDEVEARCGAR